MGVLLDEELKKRPLPPTIEGYIQDLMGWWELRNFYMRCIVQVYTWAISIFIAVAIVVVVILFFIAFLVVSSLQDDYWDAWLIVVFIYAITNVMFLMVQNAVSYHKMQLEHVYVV